MIRTPLFSLSLLEGQRLDIELQLVLYNCLYSHPIVQDPMYILNKKKGAYIGTNDFAIHV